MQSRECLIGVNFLVGCGPGIPGKKGSTYQIPSLLPSLSHRVLVHHRPDSHALALQPSIPTTEGQLEQDPLGYVMSGINDGSPKAIEEADEVVQGKKGESGVKTQNVSSTRRIEEM